MEAGVARLDDSDLRHECVSAFSPQAVVRLRTVDAPCWPASARRPSVAITAGAAFHAEDIKRPSSAIRFCGPSMSAYKVHRSSGQACYTSAQALASHADLKRVWIQTKMCWLHWMSLNVCSGKRIEQSVPRHARTDIKPLQRVKRNGLDRRGRQR